MKTFKNLLNGFRRKILDTIQVLKKVWIGKESDEDNWIPFWFETNSAWGAATSCETWNEIRANWEKGAHWTDYAIRETKLLKAHWEGF